MRAAQNISGHHKPFVVSNSCMQEREKRERERAEGRRREGEGGRQPTRAERGDRSKDGMQNAAPACPGTGCPESAGKAKRRKEGGSGPAPRREGGGEGEGGGGRERKTEETQESANGENNSLFPVQKPTQNVHPEPYKNIYTTRNGARVPKPSGNCAVITKIELRKTRLRQGELYFATFGTLGNKNQQVHQSTRARQDNKNKSSLPKMDFKNKPKKKINFAKPFRNKKTNKYVKNIGKTPPKSTRQQQDNNNKNKSSLPKMDHKNQT